MVVCVLKGDSSSVSIVLAGKWDCWYCVNDRFILCDFGDDDVFWREGKCLGYVCVGAKGWWTTAGGFL